MPWISKEDIEKAREMDLLTYLQNYEPSNLKHIKGNVYQTVDHDSLKISNGKWCWWSRGIGGVSALDYLIKVKDIEFTEAVQIITGNTSLREPVKAKIFEEEKVKSLLVPEKNGSSNKVFDYLVNKRGIDADIVNYFIKDTKTIYETKKHHNVAFVGLLNGAEKLVTLRSIEGDFKNTTSGSDRKYPFRVNASDIGIRNNVVHLFEAPIDLLSYATIMKEMGVDFKKQNMIALCGIYKPKEKIEESTLPIALTEHLNNYPYTKQICLHLDNDKAGKLSAKAIQIVLENKGYKVTNQPPPLGFKDCNDYLIKQNKLRENEISERGS